MIGDRAQCSAHIPGWSLRVLSEDLRYRRCALTVPGAFGGADRGNDFLAKGCGSHVLLAGRAFEQPLAEFAFESADLGDEGGGMDAEAGGCLAEEEYRFAAASRCSRCQARGPVMAGRSIAGAAAAAAVMFMRMG